LNYLREIGLFTLPDIYQHIKFRLGRGRKGLKFGDSNPYVLDKDKIQIFDVFLKKHHKFFSL